MKSDAIIVELQRNLAVFKETLQELPAGMITWKQDPKAWSLLEIVCHLADEEQEDFRARIKHALETPEAPLIPIDPAGWIIQRGYRHKDFTKTLSHFLEQRKNSVAWLKKLKAPNWESAVDHPEFGKITAGSFLFNWLAHDYHHIRQINAIKHAFLKQNSGDSLTYAGKW